MSTEVPVPPNGQGRMLLIRGGCSVFVAYCVVHVNPISESDFCGVRSRQQSSFFFKPISQNVRVWQLQLSDQFLVPMLLNFWTQLDPQQAPYSAGLVSTSKV